MWRVTVQLLRRWCGPNLQRNLMHVSYSSIRRKLFWQRCWKYILVLLQQLTQFLLLGGGSCQKMGYSTVRHVSIGVKKILKKSQRTPSLLKLRYIFWNIPVDRTIFIFEGWPDNSVWNHPSNSFHAAGELHSEPYANEECIWMVQYSSQY